MYVIIIIVKFLDVEKTDFPIRTKKRRYVTFEGNEAFSC